MTVPVIAIDGPAASGKGTIALAVAEALSFHHLDSGAIYRAFAWYAVQRGTGLSDSQALGAIVLQMSLGFTDGRPTIGGRVLDAELRTEAIGAMASKLAVIPAVRAALLQLQRDFRRPPGLVAEGRDMGSVVFPAATLKIFLSASFEERARRRHKQLLEKDSGASIAAVLQDLQERDQRDMQRAVAPLQASADALLLDTTGLSVGAVVTHVLNQYRQRIRGNTA